jgi:hypothetical protein
MRAKGYRWVDVLEVLRRAEVIISTVTWRQLATDYATLTRLRNATADQPPDVPDVAAPELHEMRTGGLVPPTEPAGQRGPTIHLRDGRAFPAGTVLVPLMPKEKWSIRERHKLYGNASDAPLEPPMVDISTLI